MTKKVFIRAILPIEERPSSDGQGTYRWQDIVVCWRENEESGYIQDHQLAVRLKGKSLELFQTLGYQLNDEIEINIAFGCYKSKTNGQWYNTVSGLLEENNEEQV